MPLLRLSLAALVLGLLPAATRPADTPTRDEAVRALRRAVRFFHTEVARHGGYVYQVSGDLKLREAEGVTTPTQAWVQPPGTPAVGEAFLDAYAATGDEAALQAARDAGRALLRGQLHSGGWFYSVEFDPAKRRAFSYRQDLDGRPRPDPTSPADRAAAAGWDQWKRRKYRGNLTTLDDDTTQAALRFLMRLDRTLGFKDAAVHEAVEYGLTALCNVQYANGAWSANFDRFQEKPPDATLYLPKRAAYPESWSRTWTKDFTGCYTTNDDLMPNVIRTLLLAAETYGKPRYREAAERAGRFLVQAQLPEPQPAWAQQYNRDMEPVWDRAFEPPAVSGRESQAVLEALLLLYRKTGNPEYLKPVPRAVAYLRKSRLPDGRLARFYELRTNRPLYFTRGPGGRHQLTYDDDRLATNYAFVVDSRLDAIEAEYQRLRKGGPKAPEPGQEDAGLAAAARRVIDGLDERGAWVERGRLRHHRLEPASGVINASTFADNVRTLCRFLSGE